MADVLDIERLDIERVKTEEGNRIIDIESHGEGGDKIGAHLEGIGALGELARPKLDALVFDVHTDLQLAVLDERRVAGGMLVFGSIAPGKKSSYI